jgi:outer membrane protein assembly factor BamB
MPFCSAPAIPLLNFAMDNPQQTIRQSRHKWFPVLVLVAAAAWWLWRASYAQYHTVVHVAVLLVSVVSIAVWFLFYGGFSRRVRRTTVGGLTLAVLAFFVAFRPVYNGDMGVYRWRLRFAPNADRQLAQLGSTGEAADWESTPNDYPRFLGNGYWAEVKGVELETDWKAHPPQELWRHEIGAGWSAFAIAGNYAVTQEQRGENELVTCYRVQTGEPVWSHSDATRFDPADAIGGLGDVGPRATPTISGDRIFTQGGTGVVNCLDAQTGRVIWSHDTPAELGATVTVWGKSGSPLVVDDMILISVGAPSGSWEASTSGAAAAKSAGLTSYNSSLVAFDMKTGAVRWSAGSRQASYASPVVATLAGERQIIVVNESWVTAHRVADGKILWEHPWSSVTDTNASCAQPVPLEGDRLFLSKGYGTGCSLLAIKKDADGTFSANPLWDPPIKNVMKTKMCNVVVRDGFIYGLDDVLLECIELETGAVKWKKRRRPEFGHGQILLIGNTILVLSETGELALVEANPQEYRELAHIQALDEANVTWNNPAFAPPYLLIRNAREAVCYRLQLQK